MYVLSCNDYTNSYKLELIQYLKSSLRKEASENQDFKNIFERIDAVEELVKQINDEFNKISEKYKLLFGLRDYPSLFRQDDFKQEILLYIKYKGLEK